MEELSLSQMEIVVDDHSVWNDVAGQGEDKEEDEEEAEEKGEDQRQGKSRLDPRVALAPLRVGLEAAKEEIEAEDLFRRFQKQSKADSGLTLGLLLKGYNEFIGLSATAFNLIYLILLVNMIIKQNYDSVQATGLKSAINTALAYGPPSNPTSIYLQTGLVDASAFFCNQMQAIVDDSIKKNLRSGTNEIALGNVGLFTSAAFTINLKPDYASCLGTACTTLRSVLSDAASPLREPIYRDSSHDTSLLEVLPFRTLVFDSRDLSRSAAQHKIAVDYFCGTLIPAVTPFANPIGANGISVHFVLTFQDLFEPINQVIVENQLLVINTPAVGTQVTQSFTTWFGTYMRAADPNPYRKAPGRLALEVLVFLFALSIATGEMGDFYLSYMQAKTVKSYFSSSFNQLDILSISFTLALIVAKWALGRFYFVGSNEPFHSTNDVLMSLSKAVKASFWYYGLTICLFINTIRITKFLRFHAALRTYMRFVANFFEQISGFIVVFAYALGAFAAIFWAVFAGSGTNIRYSNFNQSLNAMMLTTFNFNDYAAFTNQGIGLSAFSFITILLFWISILLFLIIFQNIVLAIVGNAHDAARRQELGPSIIPTFFNMLAFYAAFSTLFAYYAVLACFSCRCPKSFGDWYRSITSSTISVMLHMIRGGTGSKANSAAYLAAIYTIQTYCMFALHGDVLSRLSARFVECVSDDMSLMLTGRLFDLPIGQQITLDLDVLLLMPSVRDSPFFTQLFSTALKVQQDESSSGQKTGDDDSKINNQNETNNTSTTRTLDAHVVRCQGNLITVNVLGALPSDPKTMTEVTFKIMKKGRQLEVESFRSGLSKKLDRMSLHAHVFRPALVANIVDDNTDTDNSGGVCGEGRLNTTTVASISSLVEEAEGASSMSPLKTNYQHASMFWPNPVSRHRSEDEALVVPEAAIDIFNVILGQKELKGILDSIVQDDALNNFNISCCGCALSIFPPLSSQDTLRAANDLYSAFEHSLIHHNSLFNHHMSEKAKNLYESVDTFVDEAHHTSSTYSGGFRSAVVIQRLDKLVKHRLNSKLEDISRMLKQEVYTRARGESTSSGVGVFGRDVGADAGPSRAPSSLFSSFFSPPSAFEEEVGGGGGDGSGSDGGGGGGGKSKYTSPQTEPVVALSSSTTAKRNVEHTDHVWIAQLQLLMAKMDRLHGEVQEIKQALNKQQQK